MQPRPPFRYPLATREDASNIRERERTGTAPGPQTSDLFDLVYDELRVIARAMLLHERRDHTLQATALVHDLYLKLEGQSRVEWKGRGHFLAVASQAMRRILVDHARTHGRAKRGNGWHRVALAAAEETPGPAIVDVCELEDALVALEQFEPRLARLVVLRFYGGLTAEEAAGVLDVSLRTAESDWAFARAWLQKHMA